MFRRGAARREFLLNVSLISLMSGRGTVSRTPTFGKTMQTIETTNPIEARRARYAQYRGQKATLTLMGLTVTGVVRSVMEVASSSPMSWIVTVVAERRIAA
jgi:hypothetical protein